MKQGKQKFLTVGAVKRRRFLIVFIISAIALSLAVWFSVFCRVKLVTVENNEKVSDTVILTSLGLRPYRHIYSISASKLEKEVMSLSTYVKGVSVKRKLPSEIVITLDEYKADYYIVKDEKYYLVSDTLFILEEIAAEEAETCGAAPLDLPDIKEDNKYYTFGVGKTVRFADSENDTYIKDLMKTIAESPLGSRITALSLDEKANITAEIEGKYLLKLGNAKEIKRKLDLCHADIEYLSENMTGVKGTLHAWNAESITFEITGVAENP